MGWREELSAYKEAHREQKTARLIVREAVVNGELVRPDICELCGKSPAPTVHKTGNRKGATKPSITGHHWNGYENPLDVWWICHTCNRRLSGEQFHNGSVSKEEAKIVISSYDRKLSDT